MSNPNMETVQKRRRGAPDGNRNAETHGHYKRKVKLSSVSFDDINRSYGGGEQLFARRAELIAHCGGEELVSVVMIRTIELICFGEHQIAHLDLYVAELGPGIVNRRKRSIIPILRERDALVASLMRMYDAIGYTPMKRPKPSLREYLANRRQNAGEPASVASTIAKPTEVPESHRASVTPEPGQSSLVGPAQAEWRSVLEHSMEQENLQEGRQPEEHRPAPDPVPSSMPGPAAWRERLERRRKQDGGGKSEQRR